MWLDWAEEIRESLKLCHTEGISKCCDALGIQLRVLAEVGEDHSQMGSPVTPLLVSATLQFQFQFQVQLIILWTASY